MILQGTESRLKVKFFATRIAISFDKSSLGVYHLKNAMHHLSTVSQRRNQCYRIP